ncbi:MAG: VCBS repeat-containing protein [Acidobacteriota bacterium]
MIVDRTPLNPLSPAPARSFRLRAVSLCCVALIFLSVGVLVAQEGGDAGDDFMGEPELAPVMAPMSDDEKEKIEWQIEEGTDRRFQVVRMVKRPGAYLYTAEDRVRFPGGATFEVLEEDEDFFFVKAYETFGKVRPRSEKAAAPKGLTEERKKAAAKLYEPMAGADDRIRFVPFDKGLPKRGQWRNGFDLADMNADGHLDIVFGPVRKGRARPNIFLGDGAGSWRLWREAKYPEGPYDYGDAAAGDFNGDGHMDIAFGIHLRGMFLVVGDGQGGFTPWTEGIAYDVPGKGGDATSFSSRAIDTIDWNGDGKLDVIALGEGPKGRRGKGNVITGELINTSRGFGVYLNDGDGSWTPLGLENVPTNQANFADDFAMGDFNGDGRTDLVTATRRMGSNNILAMQGEAGRIEYRPLEQVRPRAFIDTVEAADFNQDGKPDIAVGYRNREAGPWRSGVDVYLQKAEGWERVTLMAKEGRRGVFGLASGDINGDDHADLVAVSGNAEIFAFLGDGSGGFVAEATPELHRLSSVGCKAFEVRIRDLDADGRDEVIAAFAGEQVGFPGLTNLNKPGCPGLGSLRVWTVADQEAVAEEPEAASGAK